MLILKNLYFGNTSLKTYSILKIKTSIAKFTTTVPDCFWKQEKEQPEGKSPFPFLAGSWLLSLVLLLCLKGQSHQSYMKQSSCIPITISKNKHCFSFQLVLGSTHTLLTAHNDTFFPFTELDNSVEIQEGKRIYPTHLEKLKKLLSSDSLCHIPRDSVFVCSFFPATQPSPRKSHNCPNKLFSLISVDYCSYTMTTTRVFPTFFSSQWKESARETSNTCKMTTLLLKKAEAGLGIRGL